jgi:spermidine synthase
MIPARPVIGIDDGRMALIVGGAVQSIDPPAQGPQPGYWHAMLPDVRPRKALVLGVGGGTIISLLCRRFGPVTVTGVEIDQEIADLAATRFEVAGPNIRIVVADALVYVGTCDETFDFVVVDLFVGPDLVKGALGKPFLKAVKRLLEPDGALVYNLTLTRRLPRHLERLRQVFRVEQAIDVEFNVVVHLR